MRHYDTQFFVDKKEVSTFRIRRLYKTADETVTLNIIALKGSSKVEFFFDNESDLYTFATYFHQEMEAYRRLNYPKGGKKA